jgi:hypothetical protein
VLTGTLSETYRYPGKPLRHAQRATGATIGFGAGHAHEVRNRGEAAALSVHAYSPPLVPTRTYPSLHHIPDRIPPLPARPRSFAELRAQAGAES